MSDVTCDTHHDEREDHQIEKEGKRALNTHCPTPTHKYLYYYS
jgi:hypothetical protein